MDGRRSNRQNFVSVRGGSRHNCVSVNVGERVGGGGNPTLKGLKSRVTGLPLLQRGRVRVGVRVGVVVTLLSKG